MLARTLAGDSAARGLPVDWKLIAHRDEAPPAGHRRPLLENDSKSGAATFRFAGRCECKFSRRPVRNPVRLTAKFGIPFELVPGQGLCLRRQLLPNFAINRIGIHREPANPPGLIIAGNSDARLVGLVCTGRVPNGVWHHKNAARRSGTVNLAVQRFLGCRWKVAEVLASRQHTCRAGLFAERRQHPDRIDNDGKVRQRTGLVELAHGGIHVPPTGI